MQVRPILATTPTHFNAIKLCDFFLKTNNQKKKHRNEKGEMQYLQGVDVKKRAKIPQGPCSVGDE